MAPERTQRLTHDRGFSLVEIMVGLAIGMIAALVIMQVSIVFEGKKRTTTGGADAETNGNLAVYTLERDIRMAGYGLNVQAALGCTVNSYYNGTQQASFTLAPGTITKTAGQPGSISILSSSKGNWSIPARITTDHPAAATNFFLNTTLGIAVNDLMIAYESGKVCTLFQVTGIPNGNVQIHHQSTSPWNLPGCGGGGGCTSMWPSGGYDVGALLFDVGSLVKHTYSVDNNYNLVLSDFQSATNTTSSQTIIPNIVTLLAKYGFDDRAGTQSDAQVTKWSDTMIDANGNGTVGDAGDIQRIYALRIAVVARSALLEKPDSSGNCSITTDTPVDNRPTWDGGTVIDVSKNPDGTTNSNWKCYRYKAFETVVPLRNLIWAQS